MLIDFQKAIKEHNLHIGGVLHVGGHHGQEAQFYLQAKVPRVIFFEPCTKAYTKLVNHIQAMEGMTAMQVALGEAAGVAQINVETANKGMSNSLLTPKEHLDHYPDIIFPDKEEVKVITLDSIRHITGDRFNTLVMDVQGYEGWVLRGGRETLKNINYVYTEVNTKELYEGCTMLYELDSLLHEFDRVETKMTNHGWGDAIYVRKKHQLVPAEFRPHQRKPYPPDNDLTFEEWFYANHTHADIRGREYLPIFWTAYYVENQYGKYLKAMDKLQYFLNSLPRKK